MKTYSRLLVALALALALAVPSVRAWAQYMYLDANGDGVNTSGDVLNPVGVATTVDVYITTNRNLDSSPAECASGSDSLSINSYCLILEAVGGSVTFSGFANHQSQWGTSFGELNAGNGYYKNGRGGTVRLIPGGPYLLCSVVITASGGDPNIQIVPSFTGSPDRTSFGTSCPGSDFDNTYKLGSDWFDVGGLGGLQLRSQPQVSAPAAADGVEGSFLSLTATATDPKGDRSVSITPKGFPPSLKLARGRTKSGSVTATLSGTPTKGQAGQWTIRWTATDSGAPSRSAAPTTILTIAAAPLPLQAVAANGCADSTATLVPIFAWDIPGDGWDIAVGTNRYVYVTDPLSTPDRICRYSLYGRGEMCWSSAGSPQDPGYFNDPRWLAWNPHNQGLYVSGQYSIKVPVFDASGSLLLEITGDSLSTEPGHFAGPTGPVAIDPRTGFAWVYEHNTLNSVTVDRIQEFDLDGTFIPDRVFNRDSSCKLPGFSEQVMDMTVDSTGSVYLLDNDGFVHTSQVSRFDPGDDHCAVSWGTGTGPGMLRTAYSLAIDKDGFINVLDRDNSGVRVRKYNRLGAYISSQPISDNPDSISFGLDFLRGVADPFMYVAHFGPNRVQVFGTGVEPLNILGTSWVDPATFQLKTSDLGLLAECTGDSLMRGVAADGVSPLLLRLHMPESGTVRWDLRDPAHSGITEKLGSLASLDSSMTGLVIQTPVQTVDGEHIAFATYTAPIDFERSAVPTDSLVGERPLRVTAQFVPGVGMDSVGITSDLTIERPPVLFVHGYLEGQDSWDDFKSIKTAADAARWGNGKVLTANYEPTNGLPLLFNTRVLGGLLSSSWKTALDRRRIASAQVDIISHSMGGILLRRLADATPQDPFSFRNGINLGRGYYHKALFLNAPHRGAPLANIVARLRDAMNDTTLSVDERIRGWLLLHLFAIATRSHFDQVIGGAIDDMSIGSGALGSLQTFTVPTHSHVGTGGSDLWNTSQLIAQSATDGFTAFIQLVATFTKLPELNQMLPPSQHDVAVLLDSQIGGLTNSSQYVTAHNLDGLHLASLSSNIAGNEARNWARRSVGDASFFASSLPGGAGYAPSPAVVPRVAGFAQAAENAVPPYAGVTLRITTPYSGFVAAGGDSFLVAVAPLSGVQKVVVIHPGGATFMDSSLTCYVHTGVALTGTFELSAIALMADGTIGRSEPVTFTLVPPGFPQIPTSIEASPSSVRLAGVGSVLELRVVGNYNDGLQRDLSSGASGTTYTGFNSALLRVSPGGVLRGSGVGVTSVVVQNGSSSQTVAVEVGSAPPVNSPPLAHAGGPYLVCYGQGVTLDASGSVDFDGDPLTYSWDLNGDGQFGDLAGATPHCIPPFITNEQLIRLRVTDSHGATSEDFTTIQAPLSCFAGVSICGANLSTFGVRDLGADGTGRPYVYKNFGTSGSIERRGVNCAFGTLSTAIYDPSDLNELAVDSSGVVYVIGATANEEILRFGPGSVLPLEPLIPVDTSPYSLVTGIAVDRNGYLYGSDYDGSQHVLIRKFDQANPQARLLANWDLTASAGIASAESLHVAVGRDSSLFVGTGNEVLKGRIQGASYVLDRRWGTFGLGAGQFRGVSDIAIGPDGDVYVADYGNHRIQRFASDGTFRSMRKGTNASAGKFYHPTGVTVLDATRVAVADSAFGGEPRVQIFYWGETVLTSVTESSPTARDMLAQNYPNPFNPSTTIAFSMSENAHVALAIYDVRGALVRILMDQPQTVGIHRATWDGKNDAGASVASGVYFYRLTAGRFHATNKMLLLK